MVLKVSGTVEVGHPVGEVIIFFFKLTSSRKCYLLSHPGRSKLLFLHVEGNWAEYGGTSEVVQ